MSALTTLFPVSDQTTFPTLPRLEAPETNPQPAPPRDLGHVSSFLHEDVAFRHSGWSSDRARVDAALVSAGIPESRLIAFRECGSRAWVWQAADDPSLTKITCSCCHDRWCLPCANARSRTITRSLAQLMVGERCRFVTLTLRSSDRPLAELIDHLYKSFAKLRRRKFWSKAVRGGAAFCEVKISRNAQTWHPHLHIICVGNYLHKQTLSDAWHEITGDSYIVDVRTIRDSDQAAGYIAKYASKPLCKTIINNHDRLVEAILALRGRRLCTTFGTWRNVNLTDDSNVDDEIPHVWVPIGPLVQIIDQAKNGIADAVDLLTLLTESNQWKPQTRPPPDNQSTDQPICT